MAACGGEGDPAVSSVRIVLPEGRVFEAGDEVHDVNLLREGDEVRDIQIDYEPATTEDAYRRAVSLASEWGLERDELEEWIAEQRAQRAGGEENTSSRALASAPGQPPSGRTGLSS